MEIPSPVPPASGVYGWFFSAAPGNVDLSRCISFQGLSLLYVGIAPKAPIVDGRIVSRATLRSRIHNHYRGNAEGSTLRLTLGCLLSASLGIELRRVGKTMTFGDGEARLSTWMAENAYVAWVEAESPWLLERELIHELDLPLNLDQNHHHAFHETLALLRKEARTRARNLPIIVYPAVRPALAPI